MFKLSSFFAFVFYLFVHGPAVHAQVVYVDCNAGDDKNSGTREAPLFSIQRAVEIIKSRDNDVCTIKINPGIYILDQHVSVATEKEMTDKRITIEASILPDEPSWTPDQMPVITCKAVKGEFSHLPHFVISFLIEANNVTIRGLKFQGYFYPHTRYFPIARLDKNKTDLLVEQCLFVGDANVAQIQAGVLASGDKVVIDHCVFYGLRNTVVFFLDSGTGFKTGNGLTHSIIYGASQAVWTVATDKDFRFENNIVSNCRYVWAKNDFNTTEPYSMDNCVIVNNQHDLGIADKEKLSPGEFPLSEHNVIKEGEISLRLTGDKDQPRLDSVDQPLPVDYMHVIPGTLGSELNAGLFKERKL